MASASASSPSSYTCPTFRCDDHQWWKYDVFLSFRGEDTRDNIISHLHASLSDKGIVTFVDYQLRKGDEIAPALLQAIRDSNVSVVIFSENYANSSWCLDELVEIMECSKTRGQIVIPVFYHVDPSDIRKQTGRFGEAFAAKFEGDSKNAHKVQKWKDALTKAADLAGWPSQDNRPERTLVERIVKDIDGKLKQYMPYGLQGLVGLDIPIRQIKRELCLGLLDVRILGIWGMGGIGKTAIAEAVFGQIKSQFEACCFLGNVREEFEKRGIKNLLEELLARTLRDEDIKVDTARPGLALIRRLHRKKLLVVLDDVDNSLDLECLIGDPCWFGPGSRVIITGRDKHIFEKYAHCIYEVEPFNDDDALKLFSWNAFKQTLPIDDFVAMSNSIVKYAKGNPLALKVLGSFLYGRTKLEWESAVNKLSNAPNKNIQNVLKISYDSLDREERDVFLHVACSFKGECKDLVLKILDSFGFSSEIGLRVLIDKSLITISEHNKLNMHDLLEEMGREIVRQESKEPGKRSRLWDPEDIYHVLMRNTGTETLESISLNLSKRREIHLCPNAFQKMPNLKFLKFYHAFGHEGREYRKLHLSRGLAFLPDELRYLDWEGYPLQSLPHNFQPSNLFVLKLRNSNIKKLWDETKDHSNLKMIARCLIETPMISQVTNLVNMILVGCLSLVRFPLFVDRFHRLTSIRLTNHHELRSLPNNIDLKFLDTLDLTGCSKLETFPEVSRNIRYLYLSRTAIKELPSSAVECLGRLVKLEMDYCENLESLPNNIDLEFLDTLDLTGCLKLKTFPEVSRNIRYLYLSRTAIKELPSSAVECLGRLVKLEMDYCENLESLPSNFWKLESLCELSLGNCSKVKKLPEILKPMDKLKKLYLHGTAIEALPLSIDRLKGLEKLNVWNCQKLHCFPETLSNLKALQFFSLIIFPRQYWKFLEQHPMNRYECQDSGNFSLGQLLGALPLPTLSITCKLRQLPADLGCFSSLEQLNLIESNIETIPGSIKQLSRLKHLSIDHCQMLESLPELPPRVHDVTAIGCRSLKRINALKQLLLESDHFDHRFNLSNCYKLDQNECGALVNAMLRNRHFSKQVRMRMRMRKKVHRSPCFWVTYPGSGIPEWFEHQSDQSVGRSARIQLSSNWFNDRFLGFALCLVVEPDFKDRRFGVQMHYECCFRYGSVDVTRAFTWTFIGWWSRERLDGEHVFLRYSAELCDETAENKHRLSQCDVALFEFSEVGKNNCKIRKCGVTPIYAQEEEDCNAFDISPVYAQEEEDSNAF